MAGWQIAKRGSEVVVTRLGAYRQARLGQLRDKRAPDLVVAATLVRVDDPAFRVDEDEVRLVVRAEPTCALA